MMVEERTIKIEVRSKEKRKQQHDKERAILQPCFQTKKRNKGEDGIEKAGSARIVTNFSMMEVRC